MKSKTYVPVSVDFVVLDALVATFVNVIVAFATTRPAGSVIVPLIVEVPVCAHVNETANIKFRKAKTRILLIRLLVDPISASIKTVVALKVSLGLTFCPAGTSFIKPIFFPGIRARSTGPGSQLSVRAFRMRSDGPRGIQT